LGDRLNENGAALNQTQEGGVKGEFFKGTLKRAWDQKKMGVRLRTDGVKMGPPDTRAAQNGGGGREKHRAGMERDWSPGQKAPK